MPICDIPSQNCISRVTQYASTNACARKGASAAPWASLASLEAHSSCLTDKVTLLEHSNHIREFLAQMVSESAEYIHLLCSFDSDLLETAGQAEAGLIPKALYPGASDFIHEQPLKWVYPQ